MPKMTPEQAAKNRERQRKWREKAFRDPKGHLLARVNVAVNPYAAKALKILADGYGITHRELIERLLESARAAVSASLMGKGAFKFEDGKLEPGALGVFDLGVVRESLQPNAVEPVMEPLRDNAPGLELEPCPPPRSDAELVGVLKANGWTLKRIREASGISETRLSRVANKGEHLSDENRVHLLSLVAEVEREVARRTRRE